MQGEEGGQVNTTTLDDPAREARGCLAGLAMSLVLWFLIILGLLTVVP